MRRWTSVDNSTGTPEQVAMKQWQRVQHEWKSLRSANAAEWTQAKDAFESSLLEFNHAWQQAQG